MSANSETFSVPAKRRSLMPSHDQHDVALTVDLVHILFKVSMINYNPTTSYIFGKLLGYEQRETVEGRAELAG